MTKYELAEQKRQEKLVKKAARKLKRSEKRLKRKERRLEKRKIRREKRAKRRFLRKSDTRYRWYHILLIKVLLYNLEGKVCVT